MRKNPGWRQGRLTNASFSTNMDTWSNWSPGEQSIKYNFFFMFDF